MYKLSDTGKLHNPIEEFAQTNPPQTKQRCIQTDILDSGEIVVGLVPNVAVTPLGKPVAVSVTLPVKPPESVTVIVSVALAPWVTKRLDADC